MITYLFDIYLLLALSDPMHVHHEAAHHCFAKTGHLSWATCPLTENGFVRIASHPRYPNRPADVPIVLALLRQFCTVEGHHFWIEDITIREILDNGSIIPHAQITDAYLLGLAIHKGGKLASLDPHIPIDAVREGSGALELITF